MNHAACANKKCNPVLFLLGLLALVIAGFLVVAWFQPNEFDVSRSISIAAPARAIFPKLNNLHRWNDWSPWAKLDSKAMVSFTGPLEGKGATMSWHGDMKVGEGTMRIVDSIPNRQVSYLITFTKPMQGSSMAALTLMPNDAHTTLVTWSTHGKNNYMGKVMGLLMNCKKMMAKSFDQGLNNLKSQVESGTSHP